MEDDTLANAITYILLLGVKSFPNMYVTLCPLKWYHSPPLAHALEAMHHYHSDCHWNTVFDKFLTSF